MILHLLLALLITYLLFCVSSFCVLRSNYKNYKPTYEALKNKVYTYYEPYGNYGGDIDYFRKPGNNDIFSEDEILFFKDRDSIKLLGRTSYIHGGMTWFLFDPYTYYWWRKLWKIHKSLMSSVESQVQEKSTIKSV